MTTVKADRDFVNTPASWTRAATRDDLAVMLLGAREANAESTWNLTWNDDYAERYLDASISRHAASTGT